MILLVISYSHSMLHSINKNQYILNIHPLKLILSIGRILEKNHMKILEKINIIIAHTTSQQSSKPSNHLNQPPSTNSVPATFSPPINFSAT